MSRQAVAVVMFILASVLFSPHSAVAQNTGIAGAVRDTSGGVIPGVTVEASSPVLIEKVRTAVTDSQGLYSIVDLRPGVYTVTFTLPGFTTVRREGIELTGSFTATVNADMRVGGLEETVTVSGQAPLVDVQSVKQQRVLSDEVVAAIPSGRTIQTLAVLVPGVSNASPYGHDVGGTALLGQQQYVAHGSDFNEYRVQVDGFILGNAYQSFTGFIPNLGSSQEVTIQMGSAQADQWSGGVLMNVVPKDGGNTYAGSFFINGATSG